MNTFSLNQILDSIDFTLNSLGCYVLNDQTRAVERVLNRVTSLLIENDPEDVVKILQRDIEGHERFIRLDSNVDYHKYAKSCIEDVLYMFDNLKSEDASQHYMMTGIRKNKDNRRIKMWVVSEEDKNRIELNGRILKGMNETYVGIEFIPW